MGGMVECEIRELTKVAYNLLENRKNSEAVEYFENAARKARETGSAPAVISTYLNAGACLVTQGEHRRGRTFLQSALKLLDNTYSSTAENSISSEDTASLGNVVRLYADIQHYLGYAYHKLDENSTALEHLATSTKLYTDEGLHKLAAESLSCMSNCYREVEHSEKKILTLKKLANIYHQLGDSSKEAETYIEQAQVFLMESNINSAKQMLSTSRMLCQRVDDYQDKCKLYCELGLAYSSIKSFDFGMECFERALAATQKIPHKNRSLQSEASILQNIGAAYNERDMVTEAVAYHQEAIAIHRKLGNHNSESKCLCNLATAQLQLGQPEDAVISFSNALAVAHKSCNIYLQLQACEGLGSIHIWWNKHGEAVVYLEQALTLLDSIPEDTGIARERIMEKLSSALEQLEESRSGGIEEEDLSSKEEQLEETSSIEVGTRDLDFTNDRQVERKLVLGKPVTRSLGPEFAAAEQAGKSTPPASHKAQKQKISLRERRGMQGRLTPIQVRPRASQSTPISLVTPPQTSSGKGKGKMKRASSEESERNSFAEDIQAYIASYADTSNDDDDQANKPGTSAQLSVGEGCLSIGPRARENFKVTRDEDSQAAKRKNASKKGQRPRGKIVSISEVDGESSSKESLKTADNRTQQSRACIIL